jgi:hypothetical protein
MYFEMDNFKCPELAIALKNAWYKAENGPWIAIRTATSNSMDIYAHAMTMGNVKVDEIWEVNPDFPNEAGEVMSIFHLKRETI